MNRYFYVQKGENMPLVDSHRNIMNWCYIVENRFISILPRSNPRIGKRDFLNRLNNTLEIKKKFFENRLEK